MRKYHRDSKGRFTTKDKAIKPKIVKVKPIKPKVIKDKVIKPKIDKKPTKTIHYRDSKGRFTTKDKAFKSVIKEKIIKPTTARKLKEGSYNITKVIDSYGNDRYIVWTNKAQWLQRLAKLKLSYNIIRIKGTKTHIYKPFVSKKAVLELLALGITLPK